MAPHYSWSHLLAYFLRKDEKISMSEKSQKAVSLLITLVSLAFVSFHLYTGYFGSLEVVKQRAIHLLLGLVLLYLISLKNSQKNSEKIINILAVLGVISTIGYFLCGLNGLPLRGFRMLPLYHYWKRV